MGTEFTHHQFCLHCNVPHPQHAHFCRICGQPLHAQTGVQPVATRKSAPGASASAIQSRSANSPRPSETSVLPFPAQLSSVQRALLRGRYRILRKLGAGGYGEVYMAKDSQFGDRLVAIKEMIQRNLKPEEVVEATEAFKREALMLASLTHPNLPSIYDYFTEGGRWYLVMSYIEGETLEAYVKHVPGECLPVEKVLQIGSQLAAVLSYLHTRKPPIIFRDLKPANIMRIPDGQIYLIDFGIARLFKQGQTRDTAALGSPGYAAPEQYGRAQTTPQTDVYSLGATLHQLLTGIDPALAPFNHAPLHLPDYPQLSILLMCMLDIDAKKRPASMGNIKRELQRIATGRSHSSTSHSQPQHLLPPIPPFSSSPPSLKGQGTHSSSHNAYAALSRIISKS